MSPSPDRCGHILRVRAYELHQDPPKCVRYAYDHPVLITAKIEDNAVIADEIDGRAELTLDLRRAFPTGLTHDRKPRADRPLGLRVSLPELSECPASDHLHGGNLVCHHSGDKESGETNSPSPAWRSNRGSA